MQILLDKKSLQTKYNMRYNGLGMVSANNSSRLLLDYKSEHPDKYWELLNLIFGENGVGINHLKIEMGSDVNSSSGTEPCIKRTPDEIANIRRGAGYQLAADAKSVNPELTLDILWWSEPAWVSKSKNIYEARYSWFRETLVAAYYVYSLKFNFISASRNERKIDTGWIKYLSKRLKSDTTGPYDFSKLKIIAADEDSTWEIADLMMKDKALNNAVNVIGSHYTSWSTENVRNLQNNFSKLVWFTEGSPSMVYEQGVHNIKKQKDSLSHINGILDIAMRIINMYALGKMTMYEFQPLIASYYDGVTYSQKQMIKAVTPWNGHYELDSGYFMALHFSLFIKKGWAFIDSGCKGSGRPGGDGHSVVDSDFGYLSALNKKTNDYSVVIVNNTNKNEMILISTLNIENVSKKIFVWETSRSNDKIWNTNMLKKIAAIEPELTENGHSYSLSVKAHSIVTLSTLDIDEQAIIRDPSDNNEILTLPYTDDFSYSSYPYAYLLSRGNAPRYMTDKGGAFEVRKIKGKNMLLQLIDKSMKPIEWGHTPEPVTDFGDDRWLNYTVESDALFDKNTVDTDVYVGVGMRYNLGDSDRSGYTLLLYSDGRWVLLKNTKNKKSGIINLTDKVNNLRIEAHWNVIKAYINNKQVCEYIVSNESLIGAGRAALYSSYHHNAFTNVIIRPTGISESYIMRLDNTNPSVTYSGDWNHNIMSTYRDYRRTISTGVTDCIASLSYYGGGILLSGTNDTDCLLKISIDGIVVEEEYSVPKSGNRECFYSYGDLKYGRHRIEITVLNGTLGFDYYEVIWKEGTPSCHIQEI